MPVLNRGAFEDVDTGGFETRVTVIKPVVDVTAGANATSAAHTFEGRVVQEAGTH